MNVLPVLPTKIERISSSEAYSIDGSGLRLQRICGSPNTSSGMPCRYEAGYRTNHLGKSYCWLHETAESKAVWDTILGGVDERTTLGKYLLKTTSLTEPQLKDVNSEIMLLYALVGSMNERGNLLPVDIDLIRKIATDLGKLKEIRGKLEREMKLEMNTVKAFIDQVFSVIVGALDKTTARRVMTQIMERVILPLSTGDDLSNRVEASDGVRKKIEVFKKEKVPHD